MTTTTAEADGEEFSEARRREVRFAVVFNGGVSLAVWMGGVAAEIDAVTREHGVYGTLLRRMDATARADVITGTSAGGINGAALALGQVQEQCDLTLLRDMWSEHGRFDRLLRRPFEGQPTSLLQGDDYFAPRLREAMEGLVAGSTGESIRPPDQRPIDLTITTTLLAGVRRTTVDSLGQALHQDVHEGRFVFRRGVPNEDETEAGDPFAAESLKDTARRLALAARCSASFPFAFEPAHVSLPVDGDVPPDIDMRGHADWGEAGVDRSRYVVDGGVLVNTPTREALAAIDRMPAGGAVRRVMLLVVPHAPEAAQTEIADSPEAPPTVVGAAASIFAALTSRAGRSYVDEIEEHNAKSARRRIGRDRVVAQLLDPTGRRGNEPVQDQLAGAANHLFRYYREGRIAQFAEIMVGGVSKTGGGSRAQVEQAVLTALDRGSASVGFVPDAVDTPGQVLPSAGWSWGAITVVRLGESVLDLIRATAEPHTTDLVAPDAATPAGAALAQLGQHRSRVHELLRTARREHRQMLDVLLTSPGESGPGITDVAHWQARISAYTAVLAEHTPALRETANELARIARRVAGWIPGGALPDLEAWRRLLTRPSEHEPYPTTEQVLTRLLHVEVLSGLLGGATSTGTTRVDLVQVSLNTPHCFTRWTHTADDKSGGMALARFSGFLKRSWRVNDWAWGRLDAATMLCRTLLEPATVRRLVEASAGETESMQVDTFLEGVRVEAYGDTAVPDGMLEAARLELLSLLGGADSSVASLPRLADLYAFARQVHLAVEEVPALAAAIRSDTASGGSKQSQGEVFLAKHRDLLETVRTTPPAERARVCGPDLLSAFDEAGVGRESLREEVASDQMIRTATTSMAVAATVLDSERSGLGAATAITRPLRGGAKIPYWVVRGLTSASTLGRLLAVVLLAVGGVVVVVEAFTGAMPQWVTIFGAAALLTGLAYCAFRSRTLLHGVALMAPVVPLLVWGVANRPKSATTSSQDLGLLVGVGALALVLALLGSFREPLASPDTFVRRATTAGWTAVVAYLRAYRIPAAAVVVLVAAGLVVAVVPDLREIALVLGGRVAGGGLLLLTGVAVATAVVAVLAVRQVGSTLLRGDNESRHPAHARGLWAWTYGLLYLVAGVAVAWVWQPAADRPRVYLAAGLLLWSITLAGLVSWLIPMLARGRLRRRAVAALARSVAVRGAGGVPQGNDALVDELRRLGFDYRFLVHSTMVEEQVVQVLTRAGRRLRLEVDAATRAPSGGP